MSGGYESVQDVPSGLIACRLNGVQQHIAALSPRSLLLRSPEPLPEAQSLTLHLLRPERGDYRVCSIQNFQTGEARRHQGAVLTRFCFEDPCAAAAIRTALNSYARYIEIKSGQGPAAYARHLTGYPAEAEECFPDSPDAQRRAWFKSMPPLPEFPGGYAVELNSPRLWQAYIRLPMTRFMDAYAQMCALPRNLLPARLPDRLYIGSSFCRHLFPGPGELRAIADKARCERTALTLVTAELRAGVEAAADELIAFAAQQRAELCVNDWGMLERAQPFAGKLPILLGPMLNRRRKDPRMQWKAAPARQLALLSENSLNSAAWCAFLGRMGVQRYEYESCALPAQLPPGSISLHMPFYQTNTALWCPLRALCTAGDRGAQAPAESCSRYCEDNVLLYPEPLKMIGRWNSLLALDADAWRRPLPPGADRIVLNF